MLAKFKLAGIALFVGAASTLFVYGMLASERNKHADTVKEFADYRIAAADASIAQALALGKDAQKVQDQLDAAIRENVELSRELRTRTMDYATNRREADERIEELKRENKELAIWAGTGVPDDWIDFMCEPSGCTTSVDP